MAQGRRATAVRSRAAPAAGVPAELPAARRIPGRHGGSRRLAGQRVLRAAEVREALGASASGRTRRDPDAGHVGAAPARECSRTCSRSTSTRPGPGAAARTRCCSPSSACARSDTARRWSRTRTASCAGAPPRDSTWSRSPPAARWTCGAGWRLARVLRGPRRPRSSTRTIRTASRWRRSHCRSGALDPAPLLVASRRVDFHLKGNSFSRWKYRQVDVLHRRVRGDSRDARRRRHRARARRHGPRGDRRRRRSTAAPAVDRARRSSGCRTTRRSSATSPRSCRTRASATWSTRPRWSCARCRTRGSSSSAKASCGRHSSAQIRELHLEKHVLLAGFRPDVLGVLKGVRRVRDELGDRGARAPRCSTRWPAPGPIVGDAGRRHPGGRRRRRDRPARAAARPPGAGRGASSAC